MIRITTSLRARLMLWLLAGATALGTILLIEAHISATRNAQRAYDAQLTAAALTMADAIRWAGDEPVVTVPAAALRILSGTAEARVYYGVFDQAGQRLTANLDLPAEPGSDPTLPAWRTVSHDGTRWRLHGRQLDLAGWSAHTSLTIWVGQTMGGRRALAARLFEPAVMRFVILILAAGGLGLAAIASTLAPVRRLRDRLAARRADDFSALDARVPGEIAPLAATLDSLFTRQRAARDSLLRFTADASHQLKTPLAGLANASEAALESDDPAVWHAALARIHATAQHAGRLAGQLLHMARLSHDTTPGDESIELATLAEQITREHAEQAALSDDTPHELSYINALTGPADVTGTRWALQEALRNLIDNALVHTPAGTAVTVRLSERDAVFWLCVIDDGPGLASASPQALRAAFRRGENTEQPGSGLGLAIVSSIAEAHGGSFSLDERAAGGCRACLRLPRARP